MEPWWEFLLENEKGLRLLCRQMCRGRIDLCDDLYSEIIDRVHDVYKNYDGTSASLKTHMYKNLRWYLWKWMNRRGRKYAEREQESLPEEYDVAGAASLNLDDADEVNVILSRLSDYDRLLLMMYHMQGLTFQEIGTVIGATKGTVRNHYLKALERARGGS